MYNNYGGDTDCYCRKCIDYLKTQGYTLFVGGIACGYEESKELNITCNFCEEFDELFKVIEP